MINQLERIAKSLTRSFKINRGKRQTIAYEDSPLADELKEVIQFIKDKFRIMEHGLVCQKVNDLFHKMESEKKELELEREALKQQQKESEQIVSIASARAEKSLQLLSQVAESFSSGIMPKNFLEVVKELMIEASSEGVKISITYEERPPVLPNAVKLEYLPNDQLILDKALYSNNCYEAAKLTFHYGMTGRRALAATYLYRYYLKVNGQLQFFANKPESKQENQIDQIQDLDIPSHISACIFYLFMEVDKSWQEMQQDPANPGLRLAELASKNNLGKLSKRLTKVARVDEHFPTLSDELIIREADKTKLPYIGKYSVLFFSNVNLDPRHSKYSYELYQSKIKVLNEDELHRLYQPLLS